jgi:hypothetical protein
MRQGNGVFLYSDDGKKIVGIKHPEGTDDGFVLSNVAVAYPYTSEGIQAAVAQILATGKPGTVLLAPMRYSITSDVSLYPKVSIKGLLGDLKYNAGYIPDQDVEPIDGTILEMQPGVTGLVYNNVDQPNPVPANLTDYAGTSINIEGIGFLGGLRGIHTGAKNRLGLTYGSVKNCRFFDQTEEHYLFDNFQHMHFEDLWAWNRITGAVAGGCVFRASRLRKGDNSIALLPGNSVWTGTIFGYSKDYLGRGIMVQLWTVS